MKVQIIRFPGSLHNYGHIIKIGEKNVHLFELNSYVAKGRITKWSEKFSALRNDGDSLCLFLDSY